LLIMLLLFKKGLILNVFLRFTALIHSGFCLKTQFEIVTVNTQNQSNKLTQQFILPKIHWNAWVYDQMFETQSCCTHGAESLMRLRCFH
jgi:hypothetical protein